MEARASTTFTRIAPRKVQVVLDLIRGKDLELAMAIVANTSKAASEPVAKLLKSAAANAENNHEMDRDALFVAETYVGAGPILKRIEARARGRAFRINKRTSHITVVLKERA